MKKVSMIVMTVVISGLLISLGATNIYGLTIKGVEEKESALEELIEEVNNMPCIENFEDITPEHKAYDSFKFLVERGVVSGISSTLIAPDSNLTRSSFVTMLARAGKDASVKKMDAENTSISFKDVIINSWYASSVNWAIEHRVTNGISKTEFGPNLLVTKEQMVQMIYNFVKNNNVKIDIVELKNEIVMDYDSCSSWAMEAINWAGNIGILDLDEDGNYHPTEEATRSDMAILLTNFLNILIVNESVSE